MPAYNPNIPQSSDRISSTWRDIRDNFAEGYQWFNLDHGSLDLNEISERGLHDRMSLITQSADPSTGATETAMYSKANGASVDIYGRSHTDGTVFPVTSGNALNIGLKLEAYAVISANQLVNVDDVVFTIPEYVYEEDGEQVTRKLSSDNVDSVSNITSADLLRCRITFSPVLSTANIFWVIEPFSPTPPRGNPFFETKWNTLNPVWDASYSSSITTSKFDFGVPGVLPLNLNANRVLYMNFQAYSVAT